MGLDTARTALLVIDVQQAFVEIEAEGAQRNNPDATSRIAALLAAARENGVAVIHIRHTGADPASRFYPSRSGHAPLEDARERDGETIFVKSVNSSFIGTGLEAHLRLAGIDTLLIVGATTNHCVETTTRMAGNLGFRAVLVRDATWCFDRPGVEAGRLHPAAEVHEMSLANLQGEFCSLAWTREIIAALNAP